ncbi:hypothetical protein BRADI_1g01946v3, partial [Brachypodium distachyon]
PLPRPPLPLVKCPCCQIRTAVRLVSQSKMNPDRVFYKCPNHRRGGCNFFHWEDGEDSYVDYLVSIGATEVEEEEEMTKEGEDSGDNTGVKILDL